MDLSPLEAQSATSASQNLTYSLKCIAYKDAYVRMDANGLTSPEPEGAGTVNAQISAGPWEQFILMPQDNNTVGLLSAAWANCYIRIGTPQPGDIKPINCQYGCGSLERWYLRFVGPNHVAFECSSLLGYYLSLNTNGATTFNGSGVGVVQGVQSLNDNSTFELISHSS
ncbi:fascin domain-containing protein [Phaeobacter porticola]|uniref:Uncharacterized protein n=1 Tax=Phaeobacter porticola TaxID=1844006 RepID=A0A1L3I0J8_9RHOB|nr:hypothetical protein [Phaeobacter porticola]APG45630.1 hypothetical protein PhaeoP97_00177 [Phaeobacter porticola]